MQKKELVHLLRFRGPFGIRYALILDGVIITTFSEDCLERACSAACNLLWAIYHKIFNFEDIKVYE